MELLTRFVLGGMFVALFALIGESVKPKTFAGLFGAAPSIALAGLILVYFTKGEHTALSETHTMIYGSLALAVYSFSCGKLVRRPHIPPWLSAGLLWLEWLAIALSLWVVTQ